MARSRDLTIVQVALWSVDVSLSDPFVVATGARVAAENVFVRVTLANGVRGYGEIAPFPEVGGEDRPSSLAAAQHLAKATLGEPAAQYKRVAGLLREMAPAHPAARCGLGSTRRRIWKTRASASVRGPPAPRRSRRSTARTGSARTSSPR